MNDGTPGATLSQISEEYELMQHIREILSKRLEFEKQHLDNLRGLRESIDSRCTTSKLSFLFGPLIKFFEDDISNRGTACLALERQLSPLQYPAPDHPDEFGVTHLSMYSLLEEPYREAKQRHDEASSPKSVSNLQAWYKRLKKITADDEISVMQIPAVDRQYRTAVCKQNTVVIAARTWHQFSLPVKLEQHQSNVKALHETILNSLETVVRANTKIMKDASAAMDSIDNDSTEGSSISFILTKHDSAAREAEHQLLQPYPYYNYCTESPGRATVRSTPVFGTTTEKLEEITSAILDRHSDFRTPLQQGIFRTDVGLTLSFEERCQSGVNLSDVVSQLHFWDYIGCLEFALANMPPLITLDDKTVTQYKDGISRRKLKALLPQDEASIRCLGTIMNKPMLPPYLPELITHRRDSKDIFKDICSKWDFTTNSPYPAGVTRTWVSEKSSYSCLSTPMYTDTGRPYIATAAVASSATNDRGSSSDDGQRAPTGGLLGVTDFGSAFSRIRRSMIL